MLSVIGQENYALYSLGTSLMAFILLDLGLSNSVTRFLSNYLAAGEFEKAYNFLGLVFKLYLLIDVIILLVLIILWFNLESIYAGLSTEEISSFKIVFLILGLFSIISFPCIPVKGIMRSFENFVELKLCELFTKVITTVSIILLLWFGTINNAKSNYLLFGLIFINSFWNIFFTGVNIIIIKRKDPIKIRWPFYNKSLFKEIFSFSVWITIIQFFERFFVIFTPTLLSIVILENAANIQAGLLGLHENSAAIQIAIFGLATALEYYAFTFVNTVNGFFMPKVSKYVYAENKAGIEELMIIVGKFQSSILGLIICGFIAVGGPFVDYWARACSYPNLVWWCAIALFIPMLFTRTQIIAGIVAEVKNEMKRPAVIYLITAVAYVITGAASCYYWGALGASISLGVISIIRQIALDYIYIKRLDLNILGFCLKCYLPISLPIIVTIVITLLFQHIYTSNSIFALLVKCILCVSLYIFLILCIGMKRAEIKRLLYR